MARISDQFSSCGLTSGLYGFYMSLLPFVVCESWDCVCSAQLSHHLLAIPSIYSQVHSGAALPANLLDMCRTVNIVSIYAKRLAKFTPCVCVCACHNDAAGRVATS